MKDVAVTKQEITVTMDKEVVVIMSKMMRILLKTVIMNLKLPDVFPSS